MDIKVTKVEFNGEDYQELLNNIKKLEEDKEDQMRVHFELKSILDYFFEQLSKVADISQVDVLRSDYGIRIESGGVTDRVRILTYKK